MMGHLSDHMGNRTVNAAGNEATTAFNGTTGHYRGSWTGSFRYGTRGLAISHPAAEGPVPQTPQPVSTPTTS